MNVRSSLRYLFPLMTLGFLIAYFYKGAQWKRVTDELKLDEYLPANYVNSTGGALNLCISWCGSWCDFRRKGEAVHSPRSCLPGDVPADARFRAERAPGHFDRGACAARQPLAVRAWQPSPARVLLISAPH
jgi:hypothetical protein